MLATFTGATNNQPEVPEYVRQAGVADGIRVYFVVDPIFRHGSYGSVIGYQMMVSANDTGFNYIPGNYLIFPAVVTSDDTTSGMAQPQAYLSVVPDGVRSVLWHFTCSQEPAGSGCEIPNTTVSVPVHDNLAVLPITNGNYYPTVNAVTWYHANGSSIAFTNQNRAVPFSGAPMWQT